MRVLHYFLCTTNCTIVSIRKRIVMVETSPRQMPVYILLSLANKYSCNLVIGPSCPSSRRFCTLTVLLKIKKKKKNRVQELCESPGGRPGLPSLISLRFCRRKVTFNNNCVRNDRFNGVATNAARLIQPDLYHHLRLLPQLQPFVPKKSFVMCMQLHRSERFSRVGTHALIQADVYTYTGDSCHNYSFLSRQNVFAMGKQLSVSPSPIRHLCWGRRQCPVLRRNLMVSYSHLKRWINWIAKGFWDGVDLNIQHTKTFF